ncbi:hypothetical protein [Agrilutibacter solisilvae]|uniref:Uncharacterized protein n=1 Tax=Agrilutibacter solisilvae TaxID=2763317 RepID=A0A974Y035_9GAMM|nr:hypothetical protein [Lysobacter solisilvae]QSX78854.1 hypothetical protein I8J32_002720 [Lysobacter solisilvae]
MRLLVVLSSLAMPAVAWLSQRGVFGPDNGTVSDRYPTLLVAAGYAFAIWGLIFLLDVAYGIWQATGARRRDPALDRVAPWAAGGFALTAGWMPLFSLGAATPGLFWVCLLVIIGALACMACAAARAVDGVVPAWARNALALHAGWLSLAVFLNLAQVIVAFRLLSPTHMLGWSLGLFAAAACVLALVNLRLRGQWGYVVAGIWGLAGVYVHQSESSLPGAGAAALVAFGIGVLILAQTLWLQLREPALGARTVPAE